jgi:hypothetical protein
MLTKRPAKILGVKTNFDRFRQTFRALHAVRKQEWKVFADQLRAEYLERRATFSFFQEAGR